jgi:hypothetical protein
VDPSAEIHINRLLNDAVNKLTEANEPITSNGKEITLEQAIDEISPKILEIANLITKKSKGFFNLL